MSQYSAIKAATNAYIKTNGRQEITGAILNAVMIATIDSLGKYYQFVGNAVPSTDPGTIDQNIAYLASTPGTYTHLGGFILGDGEVAVIKFDGEWAKEVICVIPEKVTDLVNDAEFITNAVSDLVNYYDKTEIDTYLGDIFTKQEVRTILSEYYDKDEVDSIIGTLNRQSYIVAWDGSAEPIEADIPSGVIVNYNGQSYEGTLAPSDTTLGKIYLVNDGNGDGNLMYVTSKDNGFSWVYAGATTLDLTGYATSAELGLLSAEVEKRTGEILIPTTANGRYIDTSGAIGTTIPASTASASYRYMRYPVVPGDIIKVNATGGSSPRVWCFVDENNVILSHAAYSTEHQEVTVTAPENAAKVIINDKSNSNSYYISKDSIPSKLEKIGVSQANESGFVKNSMTGGNGTEKQFVTKLKKTSIYNENAGIPSIATYETCISEIWVNPSLVNFPLFSFSKYGTYAYLYGKNTDNGTPVVTARFSTTNVQNGQVIPIVVTSAGGNANVGDLVGYVIFNDITTFNATSYSGSKCYLHRERAISLDYNRTIWYAKMATQESVAGMVNDAVSGGLEAVIPSVIYAAVGVQLNLYNDAVALSMDKGLNSPANYIVRWNCSKGTITDRCFRFTPKVSDIGDITLTCYVYTTAGSLVLTRNATIRVVLASVGSAKNVLFVGDSTGAGSANKIYSDFADTGLYGGVVPTFVGVQGTLPKYEAFGGARWADYATEGRAAFRCQVSGVGAISLGAEYTNNGFTWEVVEVNVTEGEGNILITKNSLMSSPDEPETDGILVPVGGGENIPYTGATRQPGNPFWHNGAVDFSHYRSTLGMSGLIDVIAIQLGLNGSETLSTTRQYIIDIYEAAVADNPDCIVILGLVTGPANSVDAYGVNYGAGDWMSTIKTYFDRRKMYVELAESGDYPNLRIATPNLNIDRYYGFPLGTRAVSARDTRTEEYHTNFVHPSSSGYAQIGDSFFSAIIATLNE